MGTVAFSGVSKTFSGSGGVRALADVDFQIGDGEFVALLGPSGCGKSTLLNILAGFEPLTQGVVQFDGQTVSKPGPDRGVVFQEASLLPWLTVWENVVFGPKV
jgi:NitT/TauT family transport system ATP-binding protein